MAMSQKKRKLRSKYRNLVEYMNDYSLLINDSTFIDGRPRAFKPYKGWFIISGEGEDIRDPFTSEDSGPLTIIPDPIAHGSWHTLYNLVDAEGKKLLSKGVRKIEHVRGGYYLLEDNNEDELINRGDVRGGFRTCDYKERYNIVFDDGHLLSKEWFDKIWPAMNGFFLVSKNGKYNLISLSGQFIQEEYEPVMTSFVGDKAICFHDGKLYSVSATERSMIKQLKRLNQPGHYLIGRDSFDIERESDWTQLKDWLSKLKSPFVIIENSDANLMNVLTYDGYVLFSNWYKSIRPLNLIGLYIVKRGERWVVVDASETHLEESDHEGSFHFCGHYVVSSFDGRYSILGASSYVNKDGFDSIMWADRGIWGMNILNKGNEVKYRHGQGGPIVFYAHEVLINKESSIFLGKNGLWFYYDGTGEPIQLFRYNP